MISNELKEYAEKEAEETKRELAKKNFKEILSDSRVLAKTQKRELRKISSKTILKQRLAQMYCMGNYRNKDIADILCVSECTVRKMLKDEEVLDMINEYQATEKQLVDARLKALREKALDTVYELLDSDDDSVRLNASKDILDRTGHKAKDQADINVNVSYEQQLAELGNSLIIDTDVTEG